MWKSISRIVIGLGLALLAFRAADWFTRRSASLPAVPQPNAYETLLRIGARVEVPGVPIAELNTAQLRDLAGRNAAQVAEACAVLPMPGAVPLSFARGWPDRHAENLKSLKRLAGAMGLQVHMLVLDRRTNDAARASLDLIRLGQCVARGGVLVDGLTALGIETAGVALLHGLVPSLDAATCRDLARDLEEADAGRETAERTLELENLWGRGSFGLVQRIGGWVSGRNLAQRQADYQTRQRETVRRTRGLLLRVAARAYELQNGKVPAKPTDLVPALLRAVPVDPTRNAPFGDWPAQASTPPGA